MAFSPIKDAAAKAAVDASLGSRGFDLGPLGESIASDFQRAKSEIERRVRQGELTVKVAREQASQAAAKLKAELERRSSERYGAAGFFHDRLVETIDAKRKSREAMSLDGLQRETNRMLRELLVEQQIHNRRGEFEANTYVRPVAGGQPAPTLQSLLAHHEVATLAGDEAAREWTRRQLEEFRPRTINPEDQTLIDAATDRPDALNPRLAARYVEAMKGRTPDDLERFVTEAVAAKDANACAAAFLLAKGEEQGTRVRWVRQVLNSLVEFPDSALIALRAHEAERRAGEAEEVRRQTELVIGRIETEAKLADLEAPTAAELERRARLESKPAAKPGEVIGLALDRRGYWDGEEVGGAEAEA